MELSFDSGVKEYTIRGVNGIVTVYFNPADVNFAKKAYRVFNDLRKKQKERVAKLDTTEPGDELFDMVDSIDREIRDIINVLFCFSTIFANGVKAHSIAKAPVTVSLRERRLQVLFLFRCCLQPVALQL